MQTQKIARRYTTMEVVYYAILKIDGVYSCGRCNRPLTKETIEIESTFEVNEKDGTTVEKKISRCKLCGNKLCAIDERGRAIIEEIIGEKIVIVQDTPEPSTPEPTTEAVKPKTHEKRTDGQVEKKSSDESL